jgi:hypothetical protein
MLFCHAPVAGLALLGLGCGVSDSPIRILDAHPVKSNCQADLSISQLAGTLDIAAAQTFNLAFELQSDLQQITIQSGGEELATSDRNDFIGDEIVFSYSSIPRRTFDPPESVPVHMVVKPGSTGKNSWFSMNLLSHKAAERLLNELAPGDSLDLAITLEIRGHLAWGQKLKSNSVTYPVRVYHSGFAGCPAGDRPAPTGACGFPGGQDGTPVGCCSDPAFADSCGP